MAYNQIYGIVNEATKQALGSKAVAAIDTTTLQYRISADYDWVCNALSVSRKNCYIDNYISRFMIAGVSAQQRKKSWLERYHIMKKHFGFPATCWAHLKIIAKYPFSSKD